MSRKFEWLFYLLFLLIGVLYFLSALQYPIGELTAPGPGLMPRIIGFAFVALLAGYLLVRAWSSHKSRKEQPSVVESQGKSEYTPLWVTIIVVAYTAAMDFIGFVLASILAVFFLGKAMGLDGWKKPIILSIGVAICAQFLFSFVLDVPLPKGAIFGG